MSLYVVDASVAAKWYVPEVHAPSARQLLRGLHDLHAPNFFKLEMDNLICKWVRQKTITEEFGQQTRLALAHVPLMYHPFGPLQNSAFALALLTRRSLYDCLYLALAEKLGGRMVTADRKLYDGLKGSHLLDRILWVEQLS